MQELKKPNAVIFDWDNTLVDTFPFIIMAHNFARTSFGLEEIEIHEAQHFMHHSTKETYPLWFFEKADEALKILYDFYAKNHLQHLSLIDTSEDILKLLSQKNIPVGLISNKRGDMLRKEIEHLGWNKYFKSIIGSCDAEKDKPDAAPANMALKEMAISNDNIWYVGDSESDFILSKSMRFLPFYVQNRPMLNKEKIKLLGLEYVYETTGDFHDHLKAYFDIA